MASYKIEKRPLTEREIIQLIAQIKTTPNILGFTHSEWERFPCVLVATTEDKFAGVLVYFDLGTRWSDLAVLYVLPEFRHTGLGKKLFQTAWQELESRERSVYAASRNPEVLSWFKNFGMRPVSFLHLPWEIQQHNVRFIFSIFRLKEFIRKAVQFPHQPKFVYAIKELGHA